MNFRVVCDSVSATTACGTVDSVGTATEPLLPHTALAIESEALAETRIVNVYAPPSYDTATSQRFPVLYMPDGGVDEDFRHVTNEVDRAIRAGEMRPMIVVGIENTERRRDMTGPTLVEADREIAPRVGGSAEFRAFIRDELVPLVDRRFRTDGARAIMGESLAGLFVLETFLLEPALFDVSIALSPSLWWNDGELVRSAAALVGSHPPVERVLYIATASDDDIDGAGLHLADAIRSAASAELRFTFEQHPDLVHSTIYRGAAPRVLLSLFPIRSRTPP